MCSVSWQPHYKAFNSLAVQDAASTYQEELTEGINARLQTCKLAVAVWHSELDERVPEQAGS
eukprot:3842784-Amphidinium_carterae.2